jgi:hypothetical protein
VPQAARANTSQGAEAFTRYFLSEVNRGYNSMNAEPITALSAPNCQACGIMKASIEEWRPKSYHYVGDFITPTVITVSAFPSDSTAKVLVVSNTAESKLLSESNTVVKTFPPENTSSLVSLTYSNGQWSAAEIKAAG